MRYIDKSAIHSEAVKYGRSRKGFLTTANRLATCNVDHVVDSLLAMVKPEAWSSATDTEIVTCLSRMLWMEFLQAEINLQKD